MIFRVNDNVEEVGSTEGYNGGEDGEYDDGGCKNYHNGYDKDSVDRVYGNSGDGCDWVEKEYIEDSNSDIIIEENGRKEGEKGEDGDSGDGGEKEYYNHYMMEMRIILVA